MSDLISRQMVLRCIKESRDNIDWGQSEDGDAFLHYTGALYRTIASEECLPSVHPEPQWIPCSERLPEEKGEYLVAYHPCYWDDVKAEVKVGIDSFRGKTSWAKRKHQRVIAWMPLPEYKGKE